MTNIQIQRNNWLETVRHQQSTEQEQQRHDAEMERLTGEANAEVARANRVREEQNAQSLAEAVRSAKAREGLTLMATDEQIRSNMAKEAENFRHDKQTERISSYVARNQNTREWASLDMQQEANNARNALSAAQTLQTNYMTYLKKYSHDIGLEDAQVNQIKQTMDNDRQKMALEWSKFQQARKEGDAKLAIEKKESFVKRLKTWQEIFQGSGKALGDAQSILSIITKLKGMV